MASEATQTHQHAQISDTHTHTHTKPGTWCTQYLALSSECDDGLDWVDGHQYNFDLYLRRGQGGG